MTTAICKHGIDRICERCHQCDTSMPKFALPKTPIGFAVNFLKGMVESGTWHGPTLKRAIEVISQIPDALPSTPPARDDVAALVQTLVEVNAQMLAALETVRVYVEALEKHLDGAIDNGAPTIREHGAMMRAAIKKAHAAQSLVCVHSNQPKKEKP